AAYVCSTETCGAVEDGVEDGLQARRARNGAQQFREGRLLLDEFGHPILRLRSGPFSVDTLVHAELFLGLDGEAAYRLQPQFAIALTAVQTEDAAKTSNV